MKNPAPRTLVVEKYVDAEWNQQAGKGNRAEEAYCPIHKDGHGDFGAPSFLSLGRVICAQDVASACAQHECVKKLSDKIDAHDLAHVECNALNGEDPLPADCSGKQPEERHHDSSQEPRPLVCRQQKAVEESSGVGPADKKRQQTNSNGYSQRQPQLFQYPAVLLTHLQPER